MAEKLENNSLRARVFKGSALTLFGFMGQNFLRLASNLILTRILFPEAFGLMALIQSLIIGIGMFSDLGTQTSIVRSPNGDKPAYLHSAWTIQVIRGFVIGLVLLLSAPLLADFYEEPLLAVLLPIAAIAPAIAGFKSINVALAHRHLQIGRLTVLQLTTQLAGIIVMIILAWQLQSVWALIFGNLIQTCLLTLGSHIFLKGSTSRFGYSKESFQELISFGKYIFLGTIAGYLLNHADRAVLAKFITLDVLGMFSIGMLFASLPNSLNEVFVRRVLLPIYTKRPPAKNAHNRLQLRKARWAINLPLVLVTGLLAILGNVIVQNLYDARYELAGPILVLVAISSLPPIILRSYTRLPVAAGHSGRFATLQTTIALVQLGSLIVGVTSYGIFGACFARGASWLLTYPITLALAARYKGVDIIHDAVMFALAALLAGVAIYFNHDVISALYEMSVQSVSQLN